MIVSIPERRIPLAKLLTPLAFNFPKTLFFSTKQPQ
jgi:hypothetical protein